MRILAISSQVAFGPVGLTAAVPALQAEGHEVMAIPTVTLSNHPGHGKPAGFHTEARDMAAIFVRLKELGALEPCAAVLTGYFADTDQVIEAAGAVGEMKLNNPSLYVLVDPVIGDGSGLYVPQEIAEAIRDCLVPLASCVTPNCFELGWMTGEPITDIDSAITASWLLAAPEVLAKSVPVGAGQLATLVFSVPDVLETVNRTDPGQLATSILSGRLRAQWLSSEKTGVPHGTGDFLAGLYLAQRLVHQPQVALPRAMTILEAAIDRSAGSTVLDIAGTLRT
jgi:pyridoxine kinase